MFGEILHDMIQEKPKFPNWLEVLCSSLNCSSQFCSELDSHLARQAQILAGINVSAIANLVGWAR